MTEYAGPLHQHPLYIIWAGIKNRCLRPYHHNYPLYGGKGITMYEGWQTDFPAFLAHMGHRPSPRHTVDRIDGEMGYFPGNVRWATPQEQTRNRRVTKRWEWGGEHLCLAEWVGVLELPISTLYHRLNKTGHLFNPVNPDALRLDYRHRRGAYEVSTTKGRYICKLLNGEDVWDAVVRHLQK